MTSKETAGMGDASGGEVHFDCECTANLTIMQEATQALKARKPYRGALDMGAVNMIEFAQEAIGIVHAHREAWHQSVAMTNHGPFLSMEQLNLTIGYVEAVGKAVMEIEAAMAFLSRQAIHSVAALSAIASVRSLEGAKDAAEEEPLGPLTDGCDDAPNLS